VLHQRFLLTMTDQRFPKRLRLLSRIDFREVYNDHATAGDTLIRLLGRLNDTPDSRMGLSVSRKVGNAVCRNRWKRLLREAFRLSREKLPEGLDFIVIPRENATPELEPLKKSLVDLAWRAQKRLKRDAAAKRRDSVELKQREKEERASR
jgi:ribonuclease P protein component